MRRRQFISLLGGAATWPVVAHAQQSERLHRIGVWFANPENDPEVKQQVARFQDELAKLGWVEGRTIHIDYRFSAGGDMDRYPAIAKDLVGLQPELIVTQTTPITAALQRETRTIPIVFTRVSDPVGAGFASSLARPSGNLTGLLQYEPGIVGKWLAMLKEIAPRIANVTFLGAGQADPAYSYFLQSAKTAALPLSIEVVPSPVSNDADIEHSLAAFAQLTNAGVLVAPSTVTIAHRNLIITLAARYRLPAVYPWRFFVTAGGLMSYGINDVELLRDAASYVDHILRGEKAAELPVQAPTKFQTVVNLKTAKTIGLDVPASLLVRADEVIE
jgi:putative tryptophan/tyrosine transport system substrate-binding protein